MTNELLDFAEEMYKEDLPGLLEHHGVMAKCVPFITGFLSGSVRGVNCRPLYGDLVLHGLN